MQYQMLKIKKITNKEEYKKEAYEEAHKHSCPPRVTYYLAKSQAEARCVAVSSTAGDWTEGAL